MTVQNGYGIIRLRAVIPLRLLVLCGGAHDIRSGLLLPVSENNYFLFLAKKFDGVALFCIDVLIISQVLVIFKYLSKVLVIHLREQNRRCCFVNDSQEIAILIKSIAKSKKITIKQMLSDCQLSVNTLSSMQAGGYYPRLDAIFKIADYLDVSIDYLLGRTDKPEVNR